MHSYTKKEAIAIVTACAKKYREELENRSLLFICQDKHKKISCVEFSFYSYNYLHLTGLKLKRKMSDGANSTSGEIISAAAFYEKCLSHKLSPSDFEFSDDGTTHMKLEILPTVINKSLSARMIGNYNSYNPRLYTEKLAGNITTCIGFVRTDIGNAYVPNTILKNDIRNYTNGTARVLAVYRKSMEALIYEEITYKAKNVDWATVQYPDKFLYLHNYN